MPLDAVYTKKFDDLLSATRLSGQGAKSDARRLWGKGSKTKALYLIGVSDWNLEAVPTIEFEVGKWAAYNQTIPYPFDQRSGEKGGRTIDRINQMRMILTSLHESLSQMGPFTPKTSGGASPAIALWNEGDLVPAVYMAGRWAAAKSLWDILTSKWGWDSRSNHDNPTVVVAKEIVFPGDVS